MRSVYIKEMHWGYDAGAIRGREGDGYLNIEIQLQEKEEVFYLWMSRSWDYETVMISRNPMFAIAMHMTHLDADFDLEYQYLEGNALETYEYPPLEFPERKLKHSRFFSGIRFCREALNYYPDMTEEVKEKLEKAAGLEQCPGDSLV